MRGDWLVSACEIFISHKGGALEFVGIELERYLYETLFRPRCERDRRRDGLLITPEYRLAILLVMQLAT